MDGLFTTKESKCFMLLFTCSIVDGQPTSGHEKNVVCQTEVAQHAATFRCDTISLAVYTIKDQLAGGMARGVPEGL